MMIQVLGIKRIIVLVILVAMNAALAAGVYMYVQPEKLKKQRQLSSMKSKVSQVRNDIDRIQVEFRQLEEQQEEFDRLKESGFFTKQERNKAQRIFEDIQTRSKVVSAVASIDRGSLEKNDESDKAEHVMLVSPVKVTIEALDDIDVFRYLYLLKQSFPGHMQLEKVNLERRGNITNPVLRSIVSGKNPELVKASIELTWWSMIPQTDVIDR